jgi:hypothetical protein
MIHSHSNFREQLPASSYSLDFDTLLQAEGAKDH